MSRLKAINIENSFNTTGVSKYRAHKGEHRDIAERDLQTKL